MPVPLEVEEVVAGDYSPEYGTVASVTDHEDMVTIVFKNGRSIMPTKGTQLDIEQGGRF